MGRCEWHTHAGKTASSHILVSGITRLTQGEDTEWPAAARPGKSAITNLSCRASAGIRSSNPLSTVGARFRCTMRVDCGQIDPATVIRPAPAEWCPHMPERLDEQELADWRAGRDAIYQLAALTIGARLAVAEA
jgi:hypothetical protein